MSPKFASNSFDDPVKSVVVTTNSPITVPVPISCGYPKSPARNHREDCMLGGKVRFLLTVILVANGVWQSRVTFVIVILPNAPALIVTGVYAAGCCRVTTVTDVYAVACCCVTTVTRRADTARAVNANFSRVRMGAPFRVS
jgi:hypothetical protein